MPESVDMPAPVRATQLRSRSRLTAASKPGWASTVTAKPYLARQGSATAVCCHLEPAREGARLAWPSGAQPQLTDRLPWSRRAASAREPVSDGYTVKAPETWSTVSRSATAIEMG